MTVLGADKCVAEVIGREASSEEALSECVAAWIDLGPDSSFVNGDSIVVETKSVDVTVCE